MVGPPGLGRGRLVLGPADKKRSQAHQIKCEGKVRSTCRWWAHQDLNLGPADYENLSGCL